METEKTKRLRQKQFKVRRFPLTTKTLTFKLKVRCTEFEVLADALAGTLRKEAIKTHGCRSAKVTACKVDGKEVKWGKNNRDVFHKAGR
jgi:hypothetical protein